MTFSKLLSIVVAAFAACLGAAQENVSPKATLSLPAWAKAGKPVTATIVLTFAEGLHAYQNPPSTPDLMPVAVSLKSKGLKVKSVKYPAGIMEKVAGEDKPVGVYRGTIKIPVTVILGKAAGKTRLQFDISYQQCNDSACFPPGDVQLTGTVTVKR